MWPNMRKVSLPLRARRLIEQGDIFSTDPQVAEIEKAFLCRVLAIVEQSSAHLLASGGRSAGLPVEQALRSFETPVLGQIARVLAKDVSERKGFGRFNGR